MKLNDNIATDFGNLITLAFMTFADDEDNSTNFDSMEKELFNIISEIKTGKPYESNFFSQKMVVIYLQSFTAGVIAYQESQVPIQSIIEKLAQEIVNKSTSSELEYCKTVLDSFLQKLSTSFNKPHLVSLFNSNALSSNLDFEVHYWIMAILTYYKGSIDWKQYLLTCSKILNLLESVKSLKNQKEKGKAAELFVTAFIETAKIQLPQSYINQAIQVLTADTSTLPDSETFAINDIYNLGMDMYRKK